MDPMDLTENVGSTHPDLNGDNQVEDDHQRRMSVSDLGGESQRYYERFQNAMQCLTEDERVSIDQWYKWYPGRWAGIVTEDALLGYEADQAAAAAAAASSSSASASLVSQQQQQQQHSGTGDGDGYGEGWESGGGNGNGGGGANGEKGSTGGMLTKPHVLSKKAAKAAMANLSSAERLKAWEVALIGFLRDAVSVQAFPAKWKVLAVLVGSMEGEPDSLDELDPAELGEVSNVESESSGKVNVVGSSASVGGGHEASEDVVMGDAAAAPALPPPSLAGTGSAMKSKRKKWDELDTSQIQQQQLEQQHDQQQQHQDGSMTPGGSAMNLNDVDESGGGTRRSQRKKRKVTSYDTGDYFMDFDDELSPQSATSFDALSTTSGGGGGGGAGGGVGGGVMGGDVSHPVGSRRTTRAAASAAVASGSLDFKHVALEYDSHHLPAKEEDENVITTVWSYTRNKTGRSNRTSQVGVVVSNAGSNSGGGGNGGGGDKAGATNGDLESGGGGGGGGGHGLEIRELVSTASRGFAALSAGERVEILRILVEDYGMQSASIREHVEAALERVVELKKERRELGKEWKEM
jgi:hypothetical protein